MQTIEKPRPSGRGDVTVAKLIEDRSPPVWTEDKCLTDVPANDNGRVAHVVTGDYVLPADHPSAPFNAQPAPHAARLVPRMPQPALPRVIALAGPAGSGKSTVALSLRARGYRLTKFAGPLKAMCRALGMTDEMIEGDQKEMPSDILGGHTPRHAMQTLGTEWGRNCMGEDFWVNMWARGLHPDERVVVDDCRFANEAAAVRRMGGKVIRLTGRGGLAAAHESERLDFIADEVICNDGTIADLHERVRKVLEGWRICP